MNDINSINLFDDNLDLISSMKKIAFEYQYPIGYEYIQYPMSKSPNELWGEFSTWEEVKFGGAFFRCDGHRSKRFSNYAIVDSYSLETGKTDVYRMSFSLNVPENTVFCNQTIKKDYIVFNEYIADITDFVTTGNSEKSYLVKWEGGTPDSSSITNGTIVYLMQSDALEKHTHTYADVKKVSGGGPYDLGNWQTNVYKKDRASDPYNRDSTTETHGSETRGKNLTIRVWRRVP